MMLYPPHWIRVLPWASEHGMYTTHTQSPCIRYATTHNQSPSLVFAHPPTPSQALVHAKVYYPIPTLYP